MEAYARESDESLRIADEEPTRPRGMPHSDVHDVASPSLEIGELVSDDDAEDVYWARIGDGEQVPVLTNPIEELLWDPRAPGDALVLTAIDGKSSVAKVIARCGLPTLAALQVLCDLLDQGVVRISV
jgi:hypothetical protein